MEGEVRIKANETSKFNQCIEFCNQSKGCKLALINLDNGVANIQANNLQEIFLLGRVFQIFQQPKKMGCLTFEQNNDQLNEI